MDEAITQAPASEQIAFDRTELNPTEAAKMAAWQQESGTEPTAEEPVEQALPSAQAHEFDLGTCAVTACPTPRLTLKPMQPFEAGWLMPIFQKAPEPSLPPRPANLSHSCKA